MTTLEIIITFSILFFLFPNQTSATCHETRCKAKEPWVRFPFQLLREGQDLDCGYDRGFDLSCSNHHKRTILTLPSSRDFIVKDINYIDHIIWIDDPGSCFPKRLMDHDFSLVDSPFSYFYGLESYVFLNCSSTSREEILAPSSPIDCLSSEDYKVIAVQSTWFYADLNTSSTSLRPLAQTSLSSLCSVISTAMIPLSGSFDGWDLNFGVRLAWDMPDCRLCEASGRLCGFDVATTSQVVVCSGLSNSVHQSKSGVSFRLSTATYIGGGMLVLLFICVFAICCFAKPPSDVPTTEWLAVTNHQHQRTPSALALNSVTTEAYPKTQLGDESLELPNPNEKTCAICLCEYQRKETIKTIPRCNHYFHVTCIDEWFKTNVTCPLCRNPPNNEGLGFPGQPLQDMSVGFSL